jgi:hypothetical protein
LITKRHKEREGERTKQIKILKTEKIGRRDTQKKTVRHGDREREKKSSG